MADATYTSEQFATDFLHQIGNSSPSPLLVDWVELWIKRETRGPGGAAFNPLNTTQKEPGSTFFNHLSGGLGVQNFTSYQQGVDANAQVLENGRYTSLLAALRANDLAALGIDSGSIAPSVAANLRTWGTGDFSNSLGNLFNADQTFIVSPFSGGSGSIPPATKASTSTSAKSSGSPIQINAGVLIMIGAVFLIILVAAGSIKARGLNQSAQTVIPAGGKTNAVGSV